MKDGNSVTSALEIADGFELTQVDTRLEFGLYEWLDEHCGIDPSIPGGGCSW
jgi:hypothetical protein